MARQDIFATLADDRERAMWVENDEGLYRWRLSERKSVTAFVREHREELDCIINKKLGRNCVCDD